jgi:muramoyltetrapeptide carboxypeptidase
LTSSLKSSPVKPAALRPGDTVGIVAPASNLRRDALDAGCESLRRAGYRPFYFDSILEQDLYFAGSVGRRVRELEAMFARDDVRVIVCARGGYGANYLLETLNLEIVNAHPKIFVGYSDLTALLTYFYDAAGLITFHGPMVAKDWAHDDGIDIASWQAVLAGVPAELNLGADSGITGLANGAAGGILYGGCLSILVAPMAQSCFWKTLQPSHFRSTAC